MMKKRLTAVITMSALLFIGASPWEGSAAVAPNGEMPTTGYFVATNAFPRNTVVDITNIETGRSTRVIVSNVLTSPGLLAVVSREAGELIGMRAGSLSRIRMIQPADPLARMRFTQSMAEGKPEYDSGNVITEDNLLAEVYSDDSFAPEIASAVPETLPRQPVLPAYIVDEPEWGGSGRLQIVDVPEYAHEPNERQAAAVSEPDYDGANITRRDVSKDVAPKINERPPAETAKDVPEYDPDKLFETAETPRREVVKDVPAFITEAPRKETVKEVSPWRERVEVANPGEPEPAAPSQPEPPAQTPPARQVLVPVETSPNPPSSSVYGINPNDIIPGIVIATPERPAAASANNNSNSAPTAPTAPTAPAASAAPSASATPSTPSTPSAPSADRNLSVNTIERLDRGKYYVQVAALSAELVENALRQIDRGYAPIVIKGADNIYRVLIGPLNQGESAAVLARVRSIGYKDAFVRVGN